MAMKQQQNERLEEHLEEGKRQKKKESSKNITKTKTVVIHHSTQGWNIVKTQNCKGKLALTKKNDQKMGEANDGMNQSQL